MLVERTDIDGVLLVTPKRFHDERGFFSETFRQDAFAREVAPVTFVQDNHSLSREPHTIRGLHFQIPPMAQGKLVRVLAGALWDVAVDLRTGSPSFGRFTAHRLTAENGRQIWIPSGFAHGFCTLEPNTEVLYKVTSYYSAGDERGLALDDPALAIPWPVDPPDAVVSERDRRHPRLAELPPYFLLGPAEAR